MSRYILKARCETAPNFADFLTAPLRNSTQFPPENLVVFVGDKDNVTQDMSVFPTTGGLYAKQTFRWQNLDRIQNFDSSKLFLDYQNVTVTLDVDLEPQTDPNLQYGTAGSTIPTGALAVNLGSKGFQFNTSNMLNGDEWGKLVYYEPGGLGIGWAFDATAYQPYSFQSRGGGLGRYSLGMYLMGGLLADVDFQTLANGIDSGFVASINALNFQTGRDQALLTQMNSVNRVEGPQGYWSVQPTNYDSSKARCGRWGGMIYDNSTSSDTVTPVFNSYSPFGFMSVSYPTALVLSTAVDNNYLGWNLQFPSYGPSTQDGYMPTGNALSISPGSFFTKEGLAKLQDTNSNPGTSVIVPNTKWTDYWNYFGTSTIHLQETRPFYIEAPLFNAPIAFNLIPSVDQGLSMLVPITRLYNGVYLYTPVVDESGQQMSPLKLNSQGLTNEPNYFVNPLGTLQKWFTPKRVALTINMPFVRVDTALQASRFFNTPYMTQDYAVTAPVWIKFYYWTSRDDDGYAENSFPVDTATTLKQIFAAGGMTDGMLLSFTARQILTRFLQVLNLYGIKNNNPWGLQTLEISKIIVSCTTVVELSRLYQSFPLDAFRSSPQGFILANGGTKVFSRCGSSLSGGAPSDMTIEFIDLLGDGLGSENKDGVITAVCDFSDVVDANYGTTHNDYFNQTSSFVFSNSVFLRVPENNSIDMGGQINITVKLHPFVNMPFSGEVLKNVKTGGPQLTNDTVKSGNITTSNLSSYTNGWFNNLNPYSPDYLSKYTTDNSSSGADSYPHLDYKLVDFHKRKIEVWIQLQVPVQIYSGEPFN